MKKILSVIVSILILMSLPIYVSAAGMSVSVNASSTTVKAGDTFTVNVSVSGAGNAKSGSVTVTLSDNIELVSGKWLVSNAMLTNFDDAKLKGAVAYSADTNLNGDIFKLTLKAKQASSQEQSVSVSVEYKSGTTVVGSNSSSVKIKAVCKNHTYGEYSKVNDSQHKHVCTVCEYEEKVNHTWNSGSVTKAATCKEEGVKTYTCTACKATKTETIAKTNNHTWGNWNTTKQPTCTTPGTATKTCSTCGKTENQTINATGHSMGAWSQSKEIGRAHV